MGVRPPDVVDDHVLRNLPAGPAEAKRDSLAARRAAGGCPYVVHEHTFRTIILSISPCIKFLSATMAPNLMTCYRFGDNYFAHLDLSGPKRWH